MKKHVTESIAELTAEQVRRITDPGSLGCTTSDDLEPLAGYIGQERAVEAISFGLGIENRGYNIFITGRQGTGRTGYALRSVRQKAAGQAAPDDWICVYNFDDPSRPLMIHLPAGTAKAAAADFTRLIDDMQAAVSAAFEASTYEDARAREVSSYQDVVVQTLETATENARNDGFLLKRTPQGFVNIPLKTGEDANGEPLVREMETEEYESLSDEEKAHLKEVSDSITAQTLQSLREIRGNERALKARLDDMERSACREASAPYLEKYRGKYPSKAVSHWLDGMERAITADPAAFITPRNDDSDPSRWKVNILVSNDPAAGAPVIFETNPTYAALAGRVEYENRQGAFTTDHTHIIAGSILRASGGYLIIDAGELLRNPMAYDLVRRVLRAGKLTIESPADQLGAMPVASPRPQPVAVRLRLVLIGSYEIYYLLRENDPEFSKHFKITAEFDTEMPRTPENEHRLARYLSTTAQKEGCPPITAGALAELIEHAARLAEHQDRLTTQFNRLREYLVESAAWARAENAPAVEASHVLRAITMKNARSGASEEHLLQAIEENVIRIDTTGSAIGQINGLVVLSIADTTFGQPTRITATTCMGRDGIINIERETAMAGPIHNKGHLTLSSYLGATYAQKSPLALTAHIAFEQNYGGIEGDSASSTELYCLLSSLADAPIAQNIAVTGSVDQFGNIQPIGGVNEKIEGFYRCCQRRTLTGNQGVIIPWQNRQNLMLSHEVTEAVRNGQFHIWAVKTIDEGIQLLTGIPAGTPRSDGRYPANSIHGRVMKKLRRWNRAQPTRRKRARKSRSKNGDQA